MSDTASTGRQRSNAISGSSLRPVLPNTGRPRSNAISGNSLRPVLPDTGKSPVVFAGHGSLNTITDAKHLKVRLPPGVTLVFWCHHGEGLVDSLAQFIEQKKPLSKLPEVLQALATGKSRSPIKPGVQNSYGGLDNLPEIVQGGSEIWNYRLSYPSGLTLGSQPGTVKASRYNAPVAPSWMGQKYHSYVKGVIRDNNHCIVPPLSGDIKDSGVPIIAMLAGYWEICNNNIVHWCACRSIVNR